ncbi:MAG: hypothetical protein ABI885_12525 [Gammaproteobacteria bacterium]
MAAQDEYRQLQRVLVHHGFANPPIIGITPSCQVRVGKKSISGLGIPTSRQTSVWTMMQISGTANRWCKQLPIWGSRSATLKACIDAINAHS